MLKQVMSCSAMANQGASGTNFDATLQPRSGGASGLSTYFISEEEIKRTFTDHWEVGSERAGHNARAMTLARHCGFGVTRLKLIHENVVMLPV
jgi:hypothetical protein